MKKIFLILALALTISVANAWNKPADEGIVLLAKKHLTAEGQALLTKYLGESYADDVHYLTGLEAKKSAKHTKEIHYIHLGKDLLPAKVEGDDALVAIEQSLEIVKAHKSHSKADVVKALRTVIELMCDAHNLARVRIEGIPTTQADFKFKCYGGDIGKRKVASPLSWSKLWTLYSGWHVGFSGALWAEDIDLCLGEYRAQLSKGSLREWVSETGATAARLLARINPEYSMTRRERNELEELNYQMMARAGYRLAVLINEAAK